MVKCNDIDLIVLLDSDDDTDLHRPEISRHLESCQHCQDRLALGAADTEQWDEVQRQLFTGGIRGGSDRRLGPTRRPNVCYHLHRTRRCLGALDGMTLND